MHISTLKNRFNYTIIFLILFITGILLTYSTSVRSASAAQLDTTERTHFIILIRDTGMMKKRFYPQKMIVKTLPKLLFEGAAVLRDKKPLNPPLPVYDPKHDHLSVVFVGIHQDTEPQTKCKNAPALSAKPEHLFQWQRVEQAQNQAAFTRSLRQWINKSCRAQGYVSSNVLAEMMSLSYVEEKMANKDSGKLFSKTILIFLGNDAYYGRTNPSRELESKTLGVFR
jgi:hypothetical protein